MTMPPSSDFIDDGTWREATNLAVHDPVPVEDALEQARDAVENVLVSPRQRARPTEASEADEYDQSYEIGYDDDHDDY